MIESAASVAPFSPPLTGASSIATSFAANASAITRVGPGSIELMSTTKGPRCGAVQHAPTTGEHLLDVRRVGQHRDRDVARLGHGGRALGPGGTGVDELVDGAIRARIHGEREAGGEQVPRHRLAHDAQADEPDALGRVGDQWLQASIAASVISSARSMISNPSPSCSSVMHSGGFVITFHQRMNVASPLSIRNRFSCCIVSFIWL